MSIDCQATGPAFIGDPQLAGWTRVDERVVVAQPGETVATHAGVRPEERPVAAYAAEECSVLVLDHAAGVADQNPGNGGLLKLRRWP
jgi:hypothetical protein